MDSKRKLAVGKGVSVGRSVEEIIVTRALNDVPDAVVALPSISGGRRGTGSGAGAGSQHRLQMSQSSKGFLGRRAVGAGTPLGDAFDVAACSNKVSFPQTPVDEGQGENGSLETKPILFRLPPYGISIISSITQLMNYFMLL